MLWAVCNTLPAATPNVHYSGKLVAGACNLVVDNDTMATVDFHTIGSDNFDASGQTTPVPFTLSLQDCKTALANGVLVTFRALKTVPCPDCWRWSPRRRPVVLRLAWKWLHSNQ